MNIEKEKTCKFYHFRLARLFANKRNPEERKRLRVIVIIKEFNNRTLMVECKMINHNVATIYIFKKGILQNSNFFEK